MPWTVELGDLIVTQHHNEVRDAIGDLAALAWGQFQKESVVCDAASDTSESDTLVANIRIEGVWQDQVDVIFDVWVIDTDAPPYGSKSSQTVLQRAEE